MRCICCWWRVVCVVFVLHTRSGEFSTLPSSLLHDGRIDKHAVEPLLPPGLEAAHAKPCLESSAFNRAWPNAWLAFEDVIDLRSQDKCSIFACEIRAPLSSLPFAERVNMHAVEPLLPPGPEVSRSELVDLSHGGNALEVTQSAVSISRIPEHGVEPLLPLSTIEPLLSLESGQRFELGHSQVGDHMFSSDSSSRNDDPVVNHSVYNTSTDGHGFFARPSDTLSLPCSIWNSSSSAESWSSWLVHRIARLWNGPAGQFYVLRNRRNLFTLKGGVDPSRRFGGRREREPSSSGSASPSPRVNPRYKGTNPSLFMLQLPLQRRVSLLVLSESAQTLLLQPPLTRGHPATLHLGCMCLMFPKSSA